MEDIGEITNEQVAAVLTFVNQKLSADELLKQLDQAGAGQVDHQVIERIVKVRAALDGGFKSLKEVATLADVSIADLAALAQVLGKGDQPVIEHTRAQFLPLILKNPNYFGTMPKLGLEPVTLMSSNTSYEELVCLGLNPPGNQLEAVVHIKRNVGYGSGPCDVGSREYVRFFVERGGAWQDLGVTSFNSYNIPGSHLPLSYAVAVDLNEVRARCGTEKLLRVRAILSWSVEPPPNAAWSPVWGNVVNSTVQIAPRSLLTVSLAELIKEEAISINPDLLTEINLGQSLTVAEPIPLSYAQLKAAYSGENVPLHRSGFSETQKLLKGPLAGSLLSRITANLPQAKAAGASAPTAAPLAILTSPSMNIAQIIGADLGDILEGLELTVGNTTFEELTCAGYNPHTRMMGGVITIKRNSGYSGGLCSPGSTEYVAFYLYNGSTWQALGETQVQVHDLAGVGGGHTVEYAVFRNVAVPDVVCTDVRGLRLRAILSWQVAPTGPNFSPTWGNVLNTYIQPGISHGPGVGDNELRLTRINRISTQGINAAGFANPTGVVEDCPNANNEPFGGPIFVHGNFGIRPTAFSTDGSVSPGAHPLRYQAWVNKIGDPPTQLTNSFGVSLSRYDHPLPITWTMEATAAPGIPGLSYTYMEGGLIAPPSGAAGFQQTTDPNTMAYWEAGGLDEGLYHIELRAFAWNGSQYVPTGSVTENIYIYNGYPHDGQVLINNTVTSVLHHSPQLSIAIIGGDCPDRVVGDVINGTFTVTDRFFGSEGVYVPDITIGGVTHPSPAVTLSGVTHTLITVPGITGLVEVVSGNWSLNSATMPACGYNVVLSAVDRALVGLSCSGHYNQRQVGFCLREPQP